MSINELIQWRKHEDTPKATTGEARAEIARYKAITGGARAEITRYLSGRRLDAEWFLSKVRCFFEESQVHYLRLAFRDVIAASLGMDMEQKENQRRLWEIMADRLVIGRKTAGRWKSGESDPDIDKIMIFFNSLRQECPWPRVSKIECMQMAIARTLTYSLVFPPGKGREEDFDPGPLRDELERCWAMLRQHEYYWGEQRRNLNQDALDQVRYDFRDSLWIEAQDIGAIKQRIEDTASKRDPLYFSFAIFLYVTFVDSPASHKRKENPDKWIWYPKRPQYTELWSF